jgi:aminopeptidase N
MPQEKYGYISRSLENMFEFPGSVSHQIPVLPFTINHMHLKIKPDLDKNILANCEQKLNITILRDLRELSLDISEMKIHKVYSSIHVEAFATLGESDKLVIRFAETLKKENTFDIFISYSAGYYRLNGVCSVNQPRNGFHFIPKKNYHTGFGEIQAWTQGEALESRYWFPCLDFPLVKFSLEMEIVAPDDFTVISNGILSSKTKWKCDDGINRLTLWKYAESNPIPAYLVSVVIGKFSVMESKCGPTPLYYYWPKDIQKEDAMLTFEETPQMLKFFEGYFDTKYPYQKYSQVAVNDFEFGGMENSSCTTLTRVVLHDKKTSIDYKNDILLVCHELAHQWFGDLVTCKDWPHLWLNEGFATYCELLYWENTRGSDEFYYNLTEFSDKYFEEARDQYKRPIVSKTYKHPDELFDAHSYEKAGCVLHMIRHHIGDNHFRVAIKTYLERYKNGSAESNNLLEIIEGICGKEMHQFFDQWIYGKGHPEIEMEVSMEQDNNGYSNGNNKGGSSEAKNRKLKLKITQTQGEKEKKDSDEFNPESNNSIFEFPLEVKIVFSVNNNGENKQEKHVIQISKKTTENSYDISPDANIEAISIDPEFKILKKVKSIKITNETKEFQLRGLLVNQLRNGKTIMERIGAARLLQNLYSKDVVAALQNTVMGDKFYGVSTEAANAIGSFYDKSDYEKSETAYHALRLCLTGKSLFSGFHTRTKMAIIKNIGIFEREESIDLLEPFVTGNGKFRVDGESDFLKSAAATAIGKSSKRMSSSSPSDKKNRVVIPLLKNLALSTNTFQNVVATGAIDGLKELSYKDGDEAAVSDIADFLIENTGDEKDYFIRSKATSALGKFLCNNNNNRKKNTKTENFNQRVFSRLIELLRDNRRRIKINACLALADADAKFDSAPDRRIYESLDALIYVAEHDIDGFVRRNAEASVNVLREWVKEWSSKAPTIDIKVRET